MKRKKISIKIEIESECPNIIPSSCGRVCSSTHRLGAEETSELMKSEASDCGEQTKLLQCLRASCTYMPMYFTF